MAALDEFDADAEQEDKQSMQSRLVITLPHSLITVLEH